MRKIALIALVALLGGCTRYPIVPMLESTAKTNEAATKSVTFDCSNAETGATETLIASSGKIYISSQGATFRQLQSVMMDDGKPLIKYQGDFAVWYSEPNPLLTNMKDRSYRLTCVKKQAD